MFLHCFLLASEFFQQRYSLQHEASEVILQGRISFAFVVSVRFGFGF